MRNLILNLFCIYPALYRPGSRFRSLFGRNMRIGSGRRRICFACRTGCFRSFFRRLRPVRPQWDLCPPPYPLPCRFPPLFCQGGCGQVSNPPEHSRRYPASVTVSDSVFSSVSAPDPTLYLFLHAFLHSSRYPIPYLSLHLSRPPSPHLYQPLRQFLLPRCRRPLRPPRSRRPLRGRSCNGRGPRNSATPANPSSAPGTPEPSRRAWTACIRSAPCCVRPSCGSAVRRLFRGRAPAPWRRPKVPAAKFPAGRAANRQRP